MKGPEDAVLGQLAPASIGASTSRSRQRRAGMVWLAWGLPNPPACSQSWHPVPWEGLFCCDGLEPGPSPWGGVGSTMAPGAAGSLLRPLQMPAAAAKVTLGLLWLAPHFQTAPHCLVPCLPTALQHPLPASPAPQAVRPGSSHCTPCPAPPSSLATPAEPAHFPQVLATL